MVEDMEFAGLELTWLKSLSPCKSFTNDIRWTPQQFVSKDVSAMDKLVKDMELAGLELGFLKNRLNDVRQNLKEKLRAELVELDGGD
ncbi:hypothetical protein V6N12_069473 [Hibiscus sabdariffa]|uniref:Uncharacterized protein n=1 Tax=Hibiscus sabdariffa TaxID=183260 RepID=A0ABR2FE13_9ROSI